MSKLTEVFWESVSKSWCGIGYGAVTHTVSPKTILTQANIKITSPTTDKGSLWASDKN